MLDLRRLRSLETDALGVLCIALRGAIRRGGSLAAAGVSPAIRPAVEPLVAHGLRLHRTVRSAISASGDPPLRR